MITINSIDDISTFSNDNVNATSSFSDVISALLKQANGIEAGVRSVAETIMKHNEKINDINTLKRLIMASEDETPNGDGEICISPVSEEVRDAMKEAMGDQYDEYFYYTHNTLWLKKTEEDDYNVIHTALDGLTSKYTNVNQMTMIDLQNLMGKSDNLYQTASNVLNKMGQTMSSITGNMR